MLYQPIAFEFIQGEIHPGPTQPVEEDTGVYRVQPDCPQVSPQRGHQVDPLEAQMIVATIAACLANTTATLYTRAEVYEAPLIPSWATSDATGRVQVSARWDVTHVITDPQGKPREVDAAAVHWCYLIRIGFRDGRKERLARTWEPFSPMRIVIAWQAAGNNLDARITDTRGDHTLGPIYRTETI